MYIAVKGGEQAIEASRALIDERRHGDGTQPPLPVDGLSQQLPLAVARVMAEGSLYDPALAALALKQALGDSVEAAFLLRAYRTTLPRWGVSEPLDTAAMRTQRRVSSVFKDLPGGQLLGASFDYTQRLIDFTLADDTPAAAATAPSSQAAEMSGHAAPPEPPPALFALVEQGLLEANPRSPDDPPPPDITRDPPLYPLPRAARLQMLARADEGWLLGLAYGTQRGYANSHPFAGEIRHGHASVMLQPDELDVAIDIGEVELTECQMLNQFAGGAGQPPQFTRGYGLAFGHAERKAMAMALVDRALRADELGELREAPAQQQEFVLPQGDNVEASGFVQHLKLPHHVTFESELQLLRALREPHAPGEPAPEGEHA